jgi:2,3-dihydroxybenzoate decarboxylase
MKIIDLESHFFTREYAEHLRSKKDVPREVPEEAGLKMWYDDVLFVFRSYALEERLLDIGEERIKHMDANGIDMQILSLSGPHVQFFEPDEGVYWSKKVNDELSKVVKQYPDRFIGLACVAPQSPNEAAKELERAVTKLGLKGLVLQSHARHEYLDDQKYWSIFEKAEKLDVPIYIHPEVPPSAILKYYETYGFALAGPVLGYAADVALHTMRLIYSGLFDRYPKLKIILGHLGEGLPFWLDRIDFFWLKKWVGKKPPLERRPSEYIKSNFLITTSGMSFQPAFMCAFLALGAERIAFAVDYPYEESEEALKFMKEAPICDSDKEKIYHLNTERFFKL